MLKFQRPRTVSIRKESISEELSFLLNPFLQSNDQMQYPRSLVRRIKKPNNSDNSHESDSETDSEADINDKQKSTGERLLFNNYAFLGSAGALICSILYSYLHKNDTEEPKRVILAYAIGAGAGIVLIYGIYKTFTRPPTPWTSHGASIIEPEVGQTNSKDYSLSDSDDKSTLDLSGAYSGYAAYSLEID